MGFRDRLSHAWNAFRDPFSVQPHYRDVGLMTSRPSDRVFLTRGNERTLITTVINQIAVDASEIDIRHVRLDDQGRYSDDIDDDLNQRLTMDANVDQTGRELIRDAVTMMLDRGCVALVPVETDFSINEGAFTIKELRTGEITAWYPGHVKARVYNQRTGRRQEITLPKKNVAIIENPFYDVMNQPNSIFQRLCAKLAQLDIIDAETSKNRLDVIIQLPGPARSELRREQAKRTTQDLEEQLRTSKYGVAYLNGTDKITQLNRSVENSLFDEVKWLTEQLFNQLGISQGVFDGTADEKVMNLYYAATVEPILNSLVENMRVSFLTKTARTQGQSIMYFRNPFKLVPVSSMADIADKFTRNEIFSSNEIRSFMGVKPSDQPAADDLRNKNLNPSEYGVDPSEYGYSDGQSEYESDGYSDETS